MVRKVLIATLAGVMFYLLVPQIIIERFHLMARLHGLGLAGIPDGSLTYFGLWFRYMPFYNFTFNAIFWAMVFAASFVLWEKLKRRLGYR